MGSARVSRAGFGVPPKRLLLLVGMTGSAISKTGLPVRLTDERWVHITEEHAELAGYRIDVLETIANPERIVAGTEGELLATRTQPRW